MSLSNRVSISGKDVSQECEPIVHTENRKYTSAPYLLPSDEGERTRLALQHPHYKKAFEGRLVLPKIDFSRGGNVLDSGTGSAIWILDAAKNLPPSVNLYGVDIEPGLFPVLDDSSHSARIHLSVNSAACLPKDWKDTFTLVNQRLLLGALQREEWPDAIREIRRVLVPGGWAQFGETGEWRGGPATMKQQKLLQELYAHRRLFMNCADHIPSMLQMAGFADINVEKRVLRLGNWAGQDGCDMRVNFMAVYRGMKGPILDAGGFGFVSSEGEFDTLMNDLEKEWDGLPGTEVDFVYIYGRKPNA